MVILKGYYNERERERERERGRERGRGRGREEGEQQFLTLFFYNVLEIRKRQKFHYEFNSVLVTFLRQEILEQ